MRIYNQEPVFEIVGTSRSGSRSAAATRTPTSCTTTSALPAALLWHFFAMWLLFVSLVVFVDLRLRVRPLPAQVLCRSRRARCSATSPTSSADASAMTSACATPCRSCSMPSRCSPCSLMVLSGLVLWKPVQFHSSACIMGQYEGRALRALLRHVRDRPVPGRAHRAHAAGAESAAADDHRPRAGRSAPLHAQEKRHEIWNADCTMRGLDKAEVVNLQRRLFLRTWPELGAATLLSGCDVITNTAPVDGFLRMISSFNDGVQAALFSRRPARADLSRQHGRAHVPLQRAVRRRSEIPEINPEHWRLEAVGARLRQARRGRSTSSSRCRSAPTSRATCASRAGA